MGQVERMLELRHSESWRTSEFINMDMVYQVMINILFLYLYFFLYISVSYLSFQFYLFKVCQIRIITFSQIFVNIGCHFVSLLFYVSPKFYLNMVKSDKTIFENNVLHEIRMNREVQPLFFLLLVDCCFVGSHSTSPYFL